MPVSLMIRRIRLAQGLSLKALSQASGLSISGLSLIENGLRKPSRATVASIAAALKVPSALFHSVAEPDVLTTWILIALDQVIRAETELADILRSIQ